MMCPKCGMEIKDKEQGSKLKPDMGSVDMESSAMESSAMESSAKTAVLDDLLKMLEGTAGARLGKPEAVSVELITSKDDDDEEEEV